MKKHAKKNKTGGWYYKLELSKKRSLWGLILLAPWLIGFLLFFLKPFLESVIYSFNDVQLVEGGVSLKFVGFHNYIKALISDAKFNKLILSMLYTSLPEVLVIIIFSLIAALLLNGKYKGRSIARTIFFIPIIMSTDIAGATLVGKDVISQEIAGNSGMATFGSGVIIDILSNTGLPTEIVGLVSGAVSGIFGVLSISGVPIIIFLAGLQSIPGQLYEVADIEGATRYETFWKVTLPMISPMVLLCTIYSLIDVFARYEMTIEGKAVGIVEYMKDIAFGVTSSFGLSAAMTVMYLLVNMLIIWIVYALSSKVVFYYD